MSFEAYKWVRDHSESRLAARLAAYSIADHADVHGQNAWPSIRTIMRKTRLSESAVHLALKELEDLGELRISPPEGSRRTNTYALIKMLASASDLLADGVQTLQGEGPKFAGEGSKLCTPKGPNSTPDLKDFELNHEPTHELPNHVTAEQTLSQDQAWEQQLDDACQVIEARPKFEPQNDLLEQRNVRVKALKA